MSATTEVIKDPYFSFNSVNLTGQVQEVALNFSLDEHEKTASGDTSHVTAPGLEKPTCTVRMLANYGAGSVDETLFSTKGQVVPVVIRRKQASKGADNPEYTFNAFASAWPLVAGAVGALAMIQVTLSLATAVTRQTS